MPRNLALLLLALAALAAFALSVAFGSTGGEQAELWRQAFVQRDEVARAILFDLRLPRAFTAFATGASLALAGVLMQVLLRNPLADPYVLGGSGGAAVAAVAAMLDGLSGLWVDLGAAGGALSALRAAHCRAVGTTPSLYQVDLRPLVSWADFSYQAPTEHHCEGQPGKKEGPC